MKVVHICTNYKGGAGKAAFRLHNALLDSGIQSTFVSLGSESIIGRNGKPSVLIKPENSIGSGVLRKIRKHFHIFPRLQKLLNKLKPELDYTIVSVPVSSHRLDRLPEIKDADIIHLHGVAFILDYKTFLSRLHQPLVWTLHDINPIAGIFHLSSDEQYNFEKAGQLDSIVKDYKQQCYKFIKKATIVSPSAWLLDESLKRKVFENFQHVEIANPVPKVFFENPKTIDKSQQILPGHFTILFAIADFSDKNKGLDLLAECLKYIDKENIQLLIVGSGDTSVFSNFRHIDFGYVDNDGEMAAIYNLATVLILPSRDENLPNVMLEALACGIPVASFAVGGMTQYIKNGFNGMLAEKINGESLAMSVNAILSNPEMYSRTEIRKFAFENFGEESRALKYKMVYGSFFKKP